MKKTIVLFVFLIGIPTLAFAQPQKSKNMLVTLKKIEARVQNHDINYKYLVSMLSDAKLAMNLLQDSDEPKKYPELTKYLKFVFQHYNNARSIWEASPNGGEFLASSQTGKDVSRLYPQVNKARGDGGALVVSMFGVKSYDIEAAVAVIFVKASDDLNIASNLLAKSEETSPQKQMAENKSSADDITMLKKEILGLKEENIKLKAENDLLKGLIKDAKK